MLNVTLVYLSNSWPTLEKFAKDITTTSIHRLRHNYALCDAGKHVEHGWLHAPSSSKIELLQIVILRRVRSEPSAIPASRIPEISFSSGRWHSSTWSRRAGTCLAALATHQSKSYIQNRHHGLQDQTDTSTVMCGGYDQSIQTVADKPPRTLRSSSPLLGQLKELKANLRNLRQT